VRPRRSTCSSLTYFDVPTNVTVCRVIYDRAGDRLSGIVSSAIMAKFALIVYLTVIAAMLTAGCSRDTSSQPTVPTTPTDNQVETLVHRCAATTSNLPSAHIAVGIKGTFPRLGPIAHIEADVRLKPMMANGQATYDDGTVAPFVLADDMLSVKLGNEWSELGTTSAFLPTGMIDPSRVAQTIMDSVTSLQSAGTETIDGVAARKVTGVVPARRLQDIIPDATKPADFTVWIRESGDPVLMRTTINASAEQSLTVSLSKWNAPVSLTPAPTT
jgi:lipoprotein LprG